MAITKAHMKKRAPRICECEEHAWVPLTKGFVTIFDADNVDIVGRHNWSALIAKRGGKSHPIAVRRENAGGYHYLHREIIAAPEGAVVDHKDHNTTNNRRKNLRACTDQENAMNQSAQRGRASAFKGVSYDHERSHWRAYIWHKGKRHYCGRHATEEEAARSYDIAAIRLHGEFAATNASLGLLREPFSQL